MIWKRFSSVALLSPRPKEGRNDAEHEEMRIGHIDFDERFLAARESNDLVVFAGAGVSMGPPSNLPSFAGLTEKVARWAGQRWQEDEPPEHFLGQLVHEGKLVHEQVVEILSDPDSRPTPLHEGLLDLFGNVGRVRIVTTNFDAHFESATQNVFGNLPDVYRAPALPLGNDFTGIVYLHGSIRVNPKWLVLTDQDFGRAYLAEGWARRFLRAMFARYTVLFVGYSHKDTVMHYLARGLPPEGIKPRFALVSSTDNVARWRYLGIEPLAYEKEETNGHLKLTQSVTAWAEFVNRGALDTERRVHELVSSPPPLDPESHDYLKWVLQNNVPVTFFARHANSPEWLNWADQEGFLESLFSSQEMDSSAKVLAQWVADKYVLQHPEAVFSLIERHDTSLNPLFGTMIAQQLGLGSPVPDANTLSRWISLLCECEGVGLEHQFEAILQRCFDTGAHFGTVRLIDYLTAPKVRLRKGWRPSDSPSELKQVIQVDLSFLGDAHSLKEIWEDNGTGNLNDLARELWPVLSKNLEHCHRVLRSWDQARPEWDPMSWRRSAIQPHAQNHILGVESILIDAARDTLEWAIENDMSLARTWIEAAAVSQVPLLRRLAIHGMSLVPDVTPDDKIKWLLEKGWI
ncbi:SIR2 family protein [Acidobacteria bacterium AH-259-G07]|nr:SIR2 family protein [Acidobacteria bacterium AH-259-G07]